MKCVLTIFPDGKAVLAYDKSEMTPRQYQALTDGYKLWRETPEACLIFEGRVVTANSLEVDIPVEDAAEWGLV